MFNWDHKVNNNCETITEINNIKVFIVTNEFMTKLKKKHHTKYYCCVVFLRVFGNKCKNKSAYVFKCH